MVEVLVHKAQKQAVLVPQIQEQVAAVAVILLMAPAEQVAADS
jgi:hypothetical protein